MPILNIQKRLRQVGRIRAGAKVATKNGGTRPAKLDAFRVTGPDRSVIDAVASVYGGEVQQWAGAPTGTQWEVFTKATEFDILLPAKDLAFNQWNELWSGGGVQRRCDGVRMVVKDGKGCDDDECLCDPAAPLCRPTTRLNVLLSAIEGIGVFRAESHGYSAAAELGGSMELVEQLQRRGETVQGRLVLEQRQSKGVNPKTGQQETYNYPVIALDLKLNIGAIASGTERPAIGVTPIHSELPVAPSVADQVAAATTPKERPQRSNSAAPLPATGLKPKGLSTKPEATEATKEPSVAPATDRTEGGASLRSLKRLMAILNGKKLDDDARHVWARSVLGFDTDAPISFSKLTQSEISKLNDAAETAGAPVAKETVGAYTGTTDGEMPF